MKKREVAYNLDLTLKGLMDQVSQSPQLPLLPMLPDHLVSEPLRAVEPPTANAIFSQGMSLLEHGKKKSLLLANKKFKKAVALNPQLFEAWLAWGNTHLQLGLQTDEPHHFSQAIEKFRKSIALSEGQTADILSDLYWDYGKSWYHVALHSEEALDFQLASDALQKASTFLSEMPADFWNDFGNTYLQLSDRLNDVRLCAKAITCFKHALSSAISSRESWGYLASAMQRLHSFTHDDDHFNQTNDCFAAATGLNGGDLDLWITWARFLTDSARQTGEIKRLHLSIEKCERACAIDPKSPVAKAIWAECLALLGELTERLDLLDEAQKKIDEASQLDPDNPEILYSYGHCMHSLGNYYSDFDYYYQAIEQFQYGLSIDRTCHRLWQAMAAIYYVVGALDEDREALELSCRFYTKASDIHPSTTYLFEHARSMSRIGAITRQQKHLEEAVELFQRTLNAQKNAIYIHPHWLFHYAITLDLLSDYHDDDSYCVRSIEILSHVLMIDPDFPHVHHHIALAYTHLGDLMSETDHFYRAIHHFRLAAKHEEENDQILLDWATALISLAERSANAQDADSLYREAEHKLLQSAKLGNVESYYGLAELYSLLGQYERSMRFILKAHEFKALPSLDELIHNDWLEGLRSTADFHEFLMQLEKRYNQQRER